VSNSDVGAKFRVAPWIWSVGGLGKIPLASSLWGALAGVPIFFLLFWLGWKAYLVGYLVIALLTVYGVHQGLTAYQPGDPGIVIDKLFGYLTAMFLVPQYGFLKYHFLWGLFFFLFIYFVKSLFIKGRKEEKIQFVLLDSFVCGLLACLAMWVAAALHYFLVGEFIPAIFVAS
jgi:hypothetical protein